MSRGTQQVTGNSPSFQFLAKRSYRVHVAILGLATAFLVINSVIANETVTIPQKELPSLLLSMQNVSALGDTYDPASGSVGFSVTDVSLPGNFALPVAFTRTFNVGAGRTFSSTTESVGGWSIDVPYIRAHYIDASGISHVNVTTYEGWSGGEECSGDVLTFGARHPSSTGSWEAVSPDEWWAGKFLHIPGQVSENLIVGSGTYAGHQVTSTNHKITSCFARAGGGEGIEVTGPDGTRYRFDYSINRESAGTTAAMGNARKTRYLLATQVTDKFGNTVNYNWSGEKLDSIVASDGRRIDLSYVNDRLSTVTANGRTWQYAYQTVDLGSGINHLRLRTVTRPDNRKWTYSGSFYKQRAPRTKVQSGSFDVAWLCEKNVLVSEGDTRRTFVVTTPEGATITYTVDDIFHGTANVNPYYEDIMGNLTFKNVHCNVRQNLLKRRVTFGSEVYEWNYTYSQNEGRYLSSDPKGALANSSLSGNPSVSFIHSRPATVASATVVKTTTEDGPNGKVVYYVNRDALSRAEGKVVAEDYFDNTATPRLLKRVEYDFSGGSNWGSYCSVLSSYDGENECFKKNNLQTLDYRVNGTEFKTILYDAGGAATSYTSEHSDFDFYGFHQLVKEHNSYSSKQRFTRDTVSHDLTNWVLGQPTTTEVSGTLAGPYTQVQRTEYQALSASGLYSNILVPQRYFRFGLHQRTFVSYHTDGNLKKVQLPLGNRWVEFSSYKRGQAQAVTAPKATGSGTQVFSRVVDNNGWVTSETDFRGNTTNYLHDDIGRLTEIRQANTYWLPTTVDYGWLTSGEVVPGTYVGMLKQTVTKGYYEKIVYYDNLLRPQLVTEWDRRNSNSRSTKSFRYDYNNNPIFSSYAGRDLNPNGLTQVYDALGRLTSSTKDTDSGQDSAYTHYLSGNAIQTIDYKGHATTRRYLAYGSPMYEQSESIESPESVTTTLGYNLFGNLISVSQGGITQHNVYDSYQRLCKKVRPDIGNVAYTYNGNGDIAWTAHSSSVSSSTTACDTTVDAADKITHVYDNLGRLKSLTYGDGSPTKTYTYDADGNLKKLVAGDLVQDYLYDDINNMTEESLSIEALDSVIAYTYDTSGNLSATTYPTGHVVSFATNAMGHASMVDNITSGTNYADGIKYHPSGTVDEFTYGNGMVYKLMQNSELLPASITVTKNSAIRVGFQYNYDDNANIDNIIDTQNASYNLNLTYDGLDRLDTAYGQWGAGDFDYDAMGNITNYNLGSFSLTYSYDSLKRLTSVSGSKAYSFTYDERGNVSRNKSGGPQYQYNLANQMVSVDSNTYVYDGHDRRIRKENPEGTQYFHYSSAGQLLFTYTPSGEHINYIYLGNNLIAKDNVEPTSGTVVVVPPPTPSVPTIQVDCNPCSDHAHAYTYQQISVTVNATVGCDNTCTIEWFHSGSSRFAISGNGTSYTFSEFCRPPPTGSYFNYSGSVWAKVTDTTSGQHATSNVRQLSLICN